MNISVGQDGIVTIFMFLKSLAGYRGGLKYDVQAFEEMILRVGALVEDIPQVSEMDLNPVFVLGEGNGALVVDARVHVAEVSPPLPLAAKKR